MLNVNINHETDRFRWPRSLGRELRWPWVQLSFFFVIYQLTHVKEPLMAMAMVLTAREDP
jgi:hypothetical protein